MSDELETLSDISDQNCIRGNYKERPAYTRNFHLFPGGCKGPLAKIMASKAGRRKRPVTLASSGRDVNA